MNGKLHLALGVSSGMAGGIVLVSEPKIACCFTAACIVGSLFPDIDSKSSLLGRYTLGIATIINKVFGHRGLLHTPIFLAMVWYVYAKLNTGFELNTKYWILLGFSIGFICHLLQDLMTKGGIKLLYPFIRKEFHLTNFKSNHKIHNYITSIFAIIAIFIIPKIVI